MHTKIDLTLTVTTATGTQTFTLGAAHFEAIVGTWQADNSSLAELFGIAAAHPSYSVRRSVAGSDHLPVEAALALAEDPCASVRSQVASNDLFRQAAPEELVLRLIDSDPEVAEAIANYVERFENADVNALCEALARHPDVVVRRTIASNGGTPVKWVRKLTSDPVPDVAGAARQQMSSRSR